MRQRVMIAMALACRPQLILADEPTTALDVTIQAQILSLIRDLQQELGTSMILITHNLGVIAETVDRVLIMYAGQVLEEANVEALFAEPLHPYSEGLMWSILPLEQGINKDMGVLPEIPGIVPDLTQLPPGCYFYPRCPKRLEICYNNSPALNPVRPGRQVRCWLYQ
jgi:oligopeptide/dipeptide ABC transporter ATP-binding protein